MAENLANNRIGSHEAKRLSSVATSQRRNSIKSCSAMTSMPPPSYTARLSNSRSGILTIGTGQGNARFTNR
jgi:hypothetical protein